MEKEIYLTFDFDWAPDYVIDELVAYLKDEEVDATFFVTNNNKNLDNMIKDPQFEIGIHPNFTPLPRDQIYFSDFISNCEKILDDLLKIVPNARAVRVHGLTVNTRILNLFLKKGLIWESNLYIPFCSNIRICPFYSNGLIRVPYSFEDDLYCEEIKRDNNYKKRWEVEELFENNSVKIFNFHPIHLKLNTEDMTRYYSYVDSGDLEKNINHSKTIGSKIILKKIIEYAKRRGFSFKKITDIVPT